mmetsp:Transcript_14488/g.50405  ORF Transcript_14488/g.50405 Transcript_14488/m.50405 type:complete len:224 (-) Transcript_14488:608-1279(-)
MAAPCGLSLSAAVGCCLALSVGYVGSLYAVPRRIARLHRDVPEHIHARCLAVAVASAVSVGVFAFVSRGGACYGGLFSALGFGGAWASAAAVCRVLALTAALYTGPFAAEGLGILCELDGAGRRGSVAGFLEIVLERSRDLYTREPTLALRNYVIGPATEEVVFRSCMVPLLLEADLGLGRTIFCSPLFFGVAHLSGPLESTQPPSGDSGATRVHWTRPLGTT